jgi:methylmalonyl-CoA/ethylmalonyl-CoA epimerase
MVEQQPSKLMMRVRFPSPAPPRKGGIACSPHTAYDDPDIHNGSPRMIGRLNHVAIAVPDLEAASAQYRDTLGAQVGAPQDEPDHGVTVVFIELPNTKIELLHPLGEGSPISGFLEKNPSGGIHHICYEVDDILAARDRLRAHGARVLGTGEPKIGAHGKPVLFLHPKDFNGTLVELEQA